MPTKTWIIERLRASLGDQTTSWLHALRYYWVLHTKKPNEVEMLLIPRFVREGDVVVDVGANSADWTWRLSRQVGNHGQVFAFEADPYYAEVTRKVIKLLGLRNVTFFPYGLSDKAGIGLLQIKTPEDERVVGTGHIVEAATTTHLEEQLVVKVNLMPLDEVPEVMPFAESVRLIKCDVEGHELNVFKGAMNILNWSRPFVITEVRHAEHQVDNEQQLISFFQMLDYVCYIVGPDGHSLLPFHPGDNNLAATRANRIMIPAERTKAISSIP